VRVYGCYIANPFIVGSVAVTQTEPQHTNINSLPLAPPPQPRTPQSHLAYSQAEQTTQPAEVKLVYGKQFVMLYVLTIFQP
jgi:hypothetical protein